MTPSAEGSGRAGSVGVGGVGWVLPLFPVGTFVTGELVGLSDGREIDAVRPDKVKVAAEAMPITANADIEPIVTRPAFLADWDATRAIFIDHLYPGGAPTRQEACECRPRS
ncbi:hypothetical protein ACFB49_12910 [Sphingomonas sp. DBB INV C78]